MQLVQDEKAQAIWLILLPKHLVFWAQQQEVEHLVVRQQDVRGRLAERASVINQALALSDPTTPFLAHIKARRHAAFQSLIIPEGLCKATRLVGRQRIHRVEQDRLDPSSPFLSLAVAVVEDWVEKALRLS